MQLKVQSVKVKKLSKTQLAELQATCAELAGWHKNRRLAIKAINSFNSQLLSYVRINYTKYDPTKGKDARQKASLEAKRLVQAVRNGDDDVPYADQVRLFDVSISPFKASRKECESHMVVIAKSLPGYDWYVSIHGCDSLGFATIWSEMITADATLGFRNYQTWSKMWKRLGFAPYEGHAISTWRYGKGPRKLSDEEWQEIGYKPERYSLMYAIADSLQRMQKTGANSDNPVSKGPYGDHYLRRRQAMNARYPDWTDQHRHRDAQRYMMKMLTRDLWKEINDDRSWRVLDKKIGHGYWE